MTDVKKKILKVFSQIFCAQESVDLKELDSVGFVDLMLSLEAEFQIEFHEGAFLEIESMNQLERLVQEKLVR